MQIACMLTDKDLQHNKKTIKICQLGMFNFMRKLYKYISKLTIIIVLFVCKTW